MWAFGMIFKVDSPPVAPVMRMTFLSPFLLRVDVVEARFERWEKEAVESLLEGAIGAYDGG